MILILMIGVLAISTSAIWVRLALAGVELPTLGFSLFLAAARLSLASLFLIPTWTAFRGIKVGFKAYLWAFAAGIVLALHFSAWITSLSFTSIAASTVIVTTNPIWISLLSWWGWGERLTRITVIGMAIALLGGTVIASANFSGNMGNNPLLGNFLALMGAWAVSFYFLCGREAQKQGLSLQQYIIIAYGMAALVLIPFPLWLGAGYGDYPAPIYLYVVLMAIFPQLIGHTAFNWAMGRISVTLISLIILCEPVGASLLGILVFQEIPPISVIVGGLILLGGVGISLMGDHPHQG